MAWTIDDVEALENAIKQGVKRVKYADKEIEYPSLQEMLNLRDLMKKELGLIPPTTRKFAVYNKGIYPPDNCNWK